MSFFWSLNVSSVFSIQNIIHASQKTLIQSSSCLFCYAYCFLFVCNMSAPSQAKFDFLTSHALHASHARAVLGRVRLCGVFACVKLCFEAWDNTLLTMIMNPAVVIKHVLIGKKILSVDSISMFYKTKLIHWEITGPYCALDNVSGLSVDNTSRRTCTWIMQ